MIINHNLTALNTFNSLTKNTEATQKSLQKLSSGLRINSAADDAAGLAISEKMKGQISGLEQASRNSQDGISLLQTAEGGLDQTHSILQRMRQLAVQSATDTNTSDDRTKIQAEVDQLAKEITRIANVTGFNTQNLLAGGLSDTFQIGANSNENMSVSISAMDAYTLGVAGTITTAASVSGVTTTNVNLSGVERGVAAAKGYQVVTTLTTATVTAKVAHTVIGGASNQKSLTISAASGKYTNTLDTDYIIKVASTATTTGGSTLVSSIVYSKDEGVSWTTLTGDFDKGVQLDGITLQFATSTGSAASGKGYSADAADQDTYRYSVAASKATFQLEDNLGNKIGAAVDAHYGDTTATVGDGLTDETASLQFAYTTVKNGTVKFDTKIAKSVGAEVTQGKVLANAVTVAGINVSTQAAANDAITKIDNAIKTVSVSRSQLGAYENRLTNTIDNLNTSDENITAAQSRIADVDMASEVSNYQKNNVLQQSATAMLAHANQQPQTVLQLLQG